MKSLLLLVAIFSLARGQVILNTATNPQDVPIVVTEGNNVTFQCRISNAAIILSVRLPGGSFDTSVPANVMRVGSNDEATITVINAQRSENSTAFQCGGGGVSTDIGVLNVYYPPSYDNPGDQTLIEGDMNVVVNVGLDANPTGDFTWTRNGTPVTADNIWLTASNIMFNPVRREDTGLYTISGNNTAGSNSTSFQVTVYFTPMFDVGTGNLQCSGSDPNFTCAIMTGADGTLLCSASGRPPPAVTPDNDASTTNNVQFMNNQFTITSAVPGNAGAYTCNASNSVGSDVRTFQLWVGGAPMLNNLSLTIDSPNLMISWIFDAMGVPISLFTVTVDCGGQSTTDNPPVPMMGNQVIFTQPLTTYPADTPCTVTVGASNLLGPSNNLTNVITTPAGIGPETTQTPGTPTSGGAAFSAAIFSVLLIILASLVF